MIIKHYTIFKIAGILCMLMMISLATSAQRDVDGGGKGSIMDRMYFGGGGSFGAGNDANGNKYSYYSVFPVVGYMITQSWSAGSAVSYQRYNYPDIGASMEQIGVMPFTRYNFNNLFFNLEYDFINSPVSYYSDAHKMYNRFLAGIGYTVPLGNAKRGRLNAMGSYDLLYKTPSIFPSPFVFRVFVSF